MARTLADMTPEERAQCRGLWCDYLTVNGDVIQVIYRWEKDGLASVHDPKTQDERTNQYVMVPSLTPRFDLMRAWNPDGTPVECDWQYADYRPGINRGFYTAAEVTEKGPELPEGTQVARRQVGEWEATDE